MVNDLLLDYSTYVPYNDYGASTLIFGLELEQTDIMNPEEVLYLSDEDIICTRENWDYARDTAQIFLKYDGTVDAEFVFCADTKPLILERVHELRGMDTDNIRKTSAHIHINRNWFYNHNISDKEVLKAYNYLEPLIYPISGRRSLKWALSDLYNSDILREKIPLTSKHGQCVDNMQLTAEREDTHERNINFEHRNTYELRTFSNYYNNDPEYIHDYLTFAELTAMLSLFVHDNHLQYKHNRKINKFIYNLLNGNLNHFEEIKDQILI